MKRQFTKLFRVIATICIALTMIIGVCGISVAAAEGESTLSLSLIGDSTIYLQKGTEYKEFGATAYDTIEGDLTESIAIHNAVNKDTVGMYTVSYSVSNSSSQTATASRTVVVFDGMNQENRYTRWYSGYSSSNNIYKKIIPTADGGYLLAGQIRSGSYTYLFFCKYDYNMEYQWSNTLSTVGSNTNYLYDAIELADGNFLVLSHNSFYGYYYATIVSENDGSNVYNASLSNVQYRKIQKINETQYALFAEGYQYFLILTYNAESKTFTTEKISTSFTINNAVVSGGYICSLQSSGSFYKMDLETKEVMSFDSGLSLGTCIEKSHGEYIYFCDGKTIYKMDCNFNIVKSFVYSENNLQDIYVNDTNVIAKYGQKIVFLNSDLEHVFETSTQYTFTAKDLYLDDNGNVYYCGQYYSSNYYCGLIKISDIILFNNTDDYHGELNKSIDYYQGVDVVDPLGNSLGTYTCDYSQVDISKAGNYKAYYTFTAIDDEDIKTYYVGRNIIVEPKTTFEDGAIYSGSKVVDVEGGSVTINGQPYSYGDIYNIPGASKMIITGENGYTKTINFTIELIVNGVEKDTTYYTPVIPTISGGEITLDGEAYVSETPITTKGHHTLIIKGANNFRETINFTIETTIIGIEDGKTYYETLYPDVNGENMTLNGVVWNNEPIENCGNYTLVITGTNGYRKTVTFVIETVVTDLTNCETYEEEVTPSFTKGTATLNGEPYVSGTTIYMPGLNTLVITGENGYSVTYKFTINLGVENVAQGETYIGEVTPVISGGIITLNNQPYVSGTKIDVPGYYTITVLGADGYRNDIHFVVKPYEVNVVHGETYNHSVIPVVSNGSLTLNDVPYTSGTVINTSGEYTLVIIGENGYYETITFTLVTGANVEDGEHYNDPVTLKFVGTATLNGEPVQPDTVIEKVGNYELVLTDGENTHTYNFVIEPDYSIFDGRITSCIIDFDNCTVTLNGESVTEQITISEVGNYSITIEGENGYTKTIDFAICAEANVENGGEYAAGLVVNAIGGTIKLNGEDFTDGTILSAVGTYTLTINGANGHEETITFDIVPEINGISNATVYYGSVTPSIVGGTLTLNGEDYVSDTAITEEGVYRLVISGVGGYTKTINFIVLSESFEIKENGAYMQAMSITHNVCDMEINGEAYTVGSAINTVGKNTLSFIYNGERTDITFYIFPLISGVENGAVYEGSATPIIEWNNLLLDGKAYVSGTPITEVGHHTLTVANLNGYNYEITFTVKEVWENIEADGSYEYSVAPVTNNGTLYLDGNAFTSGTTIYSVGHHTIKLVGANGYESEITFTITEQISNLEDGKEYTGTIYPSVSNAILYLDGASYSSGSSINKVGYHTLRIEGTNGYTNEYKFTILPTISGAEADKEYYPGGTYITCSNATIKLNGATWSSGSWVYNVGYQQVEIVGTNGYSYTYEFTVIPSYSGVSDGAETTSYVRFYCDYATLKLNGEAYSQGAYIYDIGNHEIEIVGLNGYSQVVSFTRKEGTSITDGEEYNYSKTVSVDYLSNFQNTIVKLDGELITNSKTLYSIGYHTLTIEGANGYKVEKTFTIKANWSGVTNGTSYTSISGTYLRLRSDSGSSSILSEEYYDKILLDGQIFTNNTYCYTVGNHKFEIYGTNGYVETIDFVINPVVNNLFDTSSVNIKNDTSYPFSLSDGVYTSINKGHSSSSTFKITAVTDIEFTLSYFVSSEANYDKLKVVKNGTEIINVSGNPGWADRVITMKAGEILTISYSKDGSASNGEDCAKFRLNMKSEGVGTKLIPEIYLNNTNTFQDETTYVLLDGQPYTLNSTIDTVGYHTLKIFGVGGYEKEYKITVIPTIADIADDATYEGSVTPNIDKCTLLLDGEAYISGTPIVAVGHHTIEMIGVNDYVLSYSFTITPSHVEDYSDKVFYKEVAVNTIENATLYLDGELYNGEKVTSLGYHTIKIEGTNGYEQSFDFSITEKPILKDVNGYKDFVDGFTSEYMVNITIPGAGLFIDGVAYTSGTDYYTVGLHYLRIVGENGYEAEYTFTLTERVNGLVNGQEYSSLKLNCENIESMQLNGVTVCNLTEVNLVGNYTLVVSGTNGYTSEYNFTIGLNLKNVENGGVYNSAIAPIVNAETIYLNGVPFTSGETVSNVGYHSMRVEGVGGYVHEISFTINVRIDGVKDGEHYQDAVCPSINSDQILLNGDAYESGTVISDIGYHKIKISGEGGYEKEISFTIDAVIDGVTNNSVYQGVITPTINTDNIKLNGEGYVSGTTISMVGNYLIVIEGKNGYKREIAFTISDNLNGVVNGETYREDITPTFNSANVTLDGKKFVSGTTILNSNIGLHELLIVGVGGYERKISFVIEPHISGVENNSVYTNSISPTINSNQIYLNGEVYSSGDVISTVGNYVLVVNGENGYKVEISFTISDNLQGLTNGATYQENVIPTFNNGTTVTLDGTTFTSGTPILSSNIGIHKLKIVGVGGYEKEYVFTIIPTVENIEVGGTYQGSVLPAINGGGFKLNGEDITLDNPISTVGNNKLTIHGTNGYVQEIAFTLEPVIENLASAYQQSFSPNVIGSGMTMKLNGSSYTNGTKIETVGNNKLVVNGYGGYTKTFTVTVVPLITGIENNSIVHGSIQIKVSPNATLKIDGVSYTNNASYTKVGNHILKITGVNGYEQTLTFTLKESSSTISTDQYNGVFKLAFDKANFEILIDGANYTSNTNYYTIGHHELTVVGSNGYASTYAITVTPTLNGIVDKGEYNEKVTVTTNNGKIYIDGTLYNAGTAYKKVGHHTLTMTGTGGYKYSIAFTVTPKVSGITEGGSYNSTASWSIPTDCTAKLDGESINVNSSTSKIGNHTIIIEGANGYQTSISFTVTETINIVDGTEYNKAITIDIPDCSAVLNGLEISDLYELNTPGSYTLTVFGTNGYTNEYKFTVVSVLSGIVDGQEYDGSVTANTSIGQWYLDDEPYVSGTLITEIGHHTLKVSGPDYEQTCSFTIAVDVSACAENLKKFNYTNSDLELYINGEKYSSGASFKQVGNHTVEYRGANGYISSANFTIEYTYNGNSDYKYQDSAVINIPNATLFVNGTQIENLTEITSIGNNIVTIKGANGYEKTVEIFIAPTLTIANGEERDEKITIKKLNATMYLDGVAISGDTVVDTHGTHTLRIEGANGYVEEISFTFNNPNNSYVIMISIVVGLVAAAFVTIIILRKKVL